MLWMFGFSLGWFPTRGSISGGVEGFAATLSRLHHMILPAITMAILSTTVTIQYLRTGLLMLRVRTMFVQLVPKVFLRELFITVIFSVIRFYQSHLSWAMN